MLSDTLAISASKCLICFSYNRELDWVLVKVKYIVHA